MNLVNNPGPARPVNPAPPKPQNIKSVKEGTVFRHVYYGSDGSIIAKPQFFNDRVKWGDIGRVKEEIGAVQLNPQPKTFQDDYFPKEIKVAQGGKEVTFKYLDIDAYRKIKNQIPDNASLPDFQTTDDVQDYFYNPSRFA